MTILTDFYQSHPMWSWLTIAVLLLAIEIATGTGWLLWATGSAAVVALLTLGHFGWPVEVATFAVLGIVSTLAAKKFLPQKDLTPGEDINDRAHQLVGKTGKAVTAISDGRGRVLVDGAEWDAETEDATIIEGAPIKVLSAGGARLVVASA